ncbi:DUF1850 domain-containing protein [Halarsenatibacter silvermanii]|uniref:DUF1850 domain-containing protein n=1 Tax=Halarsenatibacter silvermanii TaxID=321763 RepID=A0A1G9N0C2_9FIRM|nr:DUF1850 domain-containing protein [Halarsenatibacter silvermanii]SDL79919.1 hypothetical protein SAMN04488692_10966 [Halarsenatibacter silvermanii]
MKKTAAAGALLAVLIIIVLILSRLSFLTVCAGEEIIYLTPVLDENKEVVYQYTHSVERGPVREYFELTRGGFILYKTTFTSQGAGLPLDRGDFERENGLFVRSGLQEEVEVLQFRLSDQYREQFIEIDDESLQMSEWGEPGQKIKMGMFDVRELLTFFF